MHDLEVAEPYSSGATFEYNFGCTPREEMCIRAVLWFPFLGPPVVSNALACFA